MKRWIALTVVMCMLMIRASSAAQKYTLKADLNEDNVVNLIDLAILSEDWLQTGGVIAQDLLQNATFSRSSIAFLDGKEYAPNAPRKKLIAVCSVSDLEIHDEEDVIGVGPVTLYPKCVAGDYIYATEADYSNIYRSTDGITWEQTADALTGALRIFGLRDGTIFVTKPIGGYVSLFRSTTGGSDLTDSNLPASVLELPADEEQAAVLCIWNFHQAQNGTICISEYGTPGGFKESRIYRSTDNGLSFTQVYDEPNDIRHSHRIMKHEATGRWVNVYGDGASVNKLVKSDDDGASWSTLIPQMDTHFQPVDLYDYGHPTNLLYGSDAVGFIGTLNVLNCKITPIYFDGNRFCTYVFSVYYHDGVFYAGTSNSSRSALWARRTAILVSSDLMHWAVYHQFRNDEAGVRKFLGFFGGKMHGIVTLGNKGIWRRFSFSPTTVRVVNALCLDPATTNLLNTEQESSVETDTSQWGAGPGEYTRTTIDAVHGSACLRVYGDGAVTAYPAIKAVTAGKTYNLRVWLKANGQNLTGNTRWYVPSTSRYGRENRFCLSQDEWTEIALNPVTILPGETLVNLHICGRSSSFPGPYDFLIDSAQYEEGPPTRWQVGGIPRTDETLSKTVTTPAEWTELISWAPECRSEWYANSGNQYIKSWCKDADNYVELYFDPCDSTFAMQATVAGSPQTPIKSSAYTFYRNGVIRLAIRCDESSLRLSVAAAAPFEHVWGPAVDFLRSATLTSKTGDHNGTQIMSCTLLNDKLYHYVFADNELE